VLVGRLAAEQLDRQSPPSLRRSLHPRGHDAAATPAIAEVPPLPAAPGTTPAQTAQDREPRIVRKRNLEKYQALFANVEFCKKLGEEYQNPLIVTGTVLSRRARPAGFVTQNLESYDNLGRRTVTRAGCSVGAQGVQLTPDVHLHPTAGRV